MQVLRDLTQRREDAKKKTLRLRVFALKIEDCPVIYGRAEKMKDERQFVCYLCTCLLVYVCTCPAPPFAHLLICVYNRRTFHLELMGREILRLSYFPDLQSKWGGDGVGSGAP